MGWLSLYLGGKYDGVWIKYYYENISEPIYINCTYNLYFLDKLSETQGWWKACNSLHRIGYIPKSYVKIFHDESPTFNAP